ncbi:MAG TPA: UvrB/UvrC motif-containing protein [Terriglobales bacterium]|nr:UvrB/UvrC motif-containing protein [Terriglobales bacterium]
MNNEPVEAVHIDFSPERDAAIFEAIPAKPAVFTLRGEPGAEPYVSKSANLKRRLIRLLGAPEERTKRLNLRERVRSIDYALTGSDFESRWALYQALRREFPKDYRERLKLREAALVKLNLDNEYARAYVTRRVTSLKGKSLYYGPFQSRAAAEKFLNDSLDLFKMRRCDFDLNPDPQFPGCIYSEMKMCLAPCFKGCSDEQYAEEVIRVRNFLDTAGESLTRELEAEREKASAELAFEQAAAVHARIEKVHAAAHQRPEIARRLDQLSGLIVQPCAEPGCVAFFRLEAGRMSGPTPFSVQDQGEGKHLSMETRITETLDGAPHPQPGSAAELMEHLALLKRWVFRTQRVGEIFLADEKGELPMRRIVRGVSRVYRGEKEGSWSIPAGQLQIEPKLEEPPQ